MAQMTWQGYLKMLKSLTKTLEQLAQVENRKTEAVSRGDLMAVDECMKQEQVLSLSLRGFDQKRDAALRELGLEGVKLSGLIARAPAEEELETRKVVEELQRQYEIFQAASLVARNTLECNLRVIERAQQDEAAAGQSQAPRQTDFRA